MRPVDAKTMARIDRLAQEDYGITQEVLMENAGRSAAECIISDIRLRQGSGGQVGSARDKKTAIFCGKGNNGGDGFVVARYLANEFPKSVVIFLAGGKNMKVGAAKTNFNIAHKMGIAMKELKDFSPEGFTVTVDSIFGTGFTGDLPQEISDLGGIINASDLKRYAVDVPSGLDATTGEASSNCLKAEVTITFGLAKTGFFVKDGPSVSGEVIVRNIGFPNALLKEYA